MAMFAPYRGTGDWLPAGTIGGFTRANEMMAAGAKEGMRSLSAGIQSYYKNKEQSENARANAEMNLSQFGMMQGEDGTFFELDPNDPNSAEVAAQKVDELTEAIGDKMLNKFMEGKTTKGDDLGISNAIESFNKRKTQGLINDVRAGQVRLIEQAEADRERLGEIHSYKPSASSPLTSGEPPAIPEPTLPHSQPQGTTRGLDEFGSPVSVAPPELGYLDSLGAGGAGVARGEFEPLEQYKSRMKLLGGGTPSLPELPPEMAESLREGIKNAPAEISKFFKGLGLSQPREPDLGYLDSFNARGAGDYVGRGEFEPLEQYKSRMNALRGGDTPSSPKLSPEAAESLREGIKSAPAEINKFFKGLGLSQPMHPEEGAFQHPPTDSPPEGGIPSEAAQTGRAMIDALGLTPEQIQTMQEAISPKGLFSFYTAVGNGVSTIPEMLSKAFDKPERDRIVAQASPEALAGSTPVPYEFSHAFYNRGMPADPAVEPPQVEPAGWRKHYNEIEQRLGGFRRQEEVDAAVRRARGLAPLQEDFGREVEKMRRHAISISDPAQKRKWVEGYGLQIANEYRGMEKRGLDLLRGEVNNILGSGLTTEAVPGSDQMAVLAHGKFIGFASASQPAPSNVGVRLLAPDGTPTGKILVMGKVVDDPDVTKKEAEAAEAKIQKTVEVNIRPKMVDGKPEGIGSITGHAGTPTEAKDMRDRWAAAEEALVQFDKMITASEDDSWAPWTGSGWEASWTKKGKEAAASQAILIGKLRIALLGPGQMTDAEAERIKTAIPNPREWGTNMSAAGAALKQTRASMMQSLRLRAVAQGLTFTEGSKFNISGAANAPLFSPAEVDAYRQRNGVAPPSINVPQPGGSSDVTDLEETINRP